MSLGTIYANKQVIQQSILDVLNEVAGSPIRQVVNSVVNAQNDLDQNDVRAVIRVMLDEGALRLGRDFHLEKVVQENAEAA